MLLKNNDFIKKSQIFFKNLQNLDEICLFKVNDTKL